MGSIIHERKHKKEHHITIFFKVGDVSFLRHTLNIKIFVVNMDQKKMPITVIGLTDGSER